MERNGSEFFWWTLRNCFLPRAGLQCAVFADRATSMKRSEPGDMMRSPGKAGRRSSRACVCLQPGCFNCGLLGILAGLPRDKGVRCIERCDTCETFESDEPACKEYARIHGGWCGYDFDLKVVWIPL